MKSVFHFIIISFLAAIVTLSSCGGDATDNPFGVDYSSSDDGQVAPDLNDLKIGNITSSSLTLAKPTFKTPGTPAPAVNAYIGEYGTISVFRDTVNSGTYTEGPVDVSDGPYTFQNLNASKSYQIIVVAKNEKDASVKRTSKIILSEVPPLLNSLVLSSDADSITLQYPTYQMPPNPQPDLTAYCFDPTLGADPLTLDDPDPSTSSEVIGEYDLTYTSDPVTFVGLEVNQEYRILVTAQNTVDGNVETDQEEASITTEIKPPVINLLTKQSSFPEEFTVAYNITAKPEAASSGFFEIDRISDQYDPNSAPVNVPLTTQGTSANISIVTGTQTFTFENTNVIDTSGSNEPLVPYTKYRITLSAQTTGSNPPDATITTLDIETTGIAPILNNLSASVGSYSSGNNSITLTQPDFSNTPYPDVSNGMTVKAYIGNYGTISNVNDSISGNLDQSTVQALTGCSVDSSGGVDTTSGDCTFSGLGDNKNFEIIVVAKNIEGYSVKKTGELKTLGKPEISNFSVDDTSFVTNDQFPNTWAASTEYSDSDCVIPKNVNNGHAYKMTAGGTATSGSSEPSWPIVIGSTVTDNGITWTEDSSCIPNFKTTSFNIEYLISANDTITSSSATIVETGEVDTSVDDTKVAHTLNLTTSLDVYSSYTLRLSAESSCCGTTTKEISFTTAGSKPGIIDFVSDNITPDETTLSINDVKITGKPQPAVTLEYTHLTSGSSGSDSITLTGSGPYTFNTTPHVISSLMKNESYSVKITATNSAGSTSYNLSKNTGGPPILGDIDAEEVTSSIVTVRQPVLLAGKDTFKPDSIIAYIGETGTITQNGKVINAASDSFTFNVNDVLNQNTIDPSSRQFTSLSSTKDYTVYIVAESSYGYSVKSFEASTYSVTPELRPPYIFYSSPTNIYIGRPLFKKRGTDTLTVMASITDGTYSEGNIDVTSGKNITTIDGNNLTADTRHTITIQPHDGTSLVGDSQTLYHSTGNAAPTIIKPSNLSDFEDNFIESVDSSSITCRRGYASEDGTNYSKIIAYIGPTSMTCDISSNSLSVSGEILGPVDITTRSYQFTNLSANTEYQICIGKENSSGADIISSDNKITTTATTTAPVLDNLNTYEIISSFDTNSITIVQPTLSTTGSPTPTVKGYIGIDTTINYNSTNGNVTGTIDTIADLSSSGNTFTLNSNGAQTYRIIIVAENSAGRDDAQGTVLMRDAGTNFTSYGALNPAADTMTLTDSSSSVNNYLISAIDGTAAPSTFPWLTTGTPDVYITDNGHWARVVIPYGSATAISKVVINSTGYASGSFPDNFVDTPPTDATYYFKLDYTSNNTTNDATSNTLMIKWTNGVSDFLYELITITVNSGLSVEQHAL